MGLCSSASARAHQLLRNTPACWYRYSRIMSACTCTRGVAPRLCMLLRTKRNVLLMALASTPDSADVACGSSLSCVWRKNCRACSSTAGSTSSPAMAFTSVSAARTNRPGNVSTFTHTSAQCARYAYCVKMQLFTSTASARAMSSYVVAFHCNSVRKQTMRASAPYISSMAALRRSNA